MSDESCQGIKFSDVVDLRPGDLSILIRCGGPCPYRWINLDKSSFAIFKFQATQWIRERPNPDDRVWPFECLNENGVWSFDRQERLIEMRTTSKEKQQERELVDEIKKLCKERGIE